MLIKYSDARIPRDFNVDRSRWRHCEKPWLRQCHKGSDKELWYYTTKPWDKADLPYVRHRIPNLCQQ